MDSLTVFQGGGHLLTLYEEHDVLYYLINRLGAILPSQPRKIHKAFFGVYPSDAYMRR